MGSSMNPPSKSSIRNPHSRFSTRSLQKSSRKSVLQDRKSSLSSSKMHQNSKNNLNDYIQGTENTQIRNGQLFIMSRHQDIQISVKEINQMNGQKLSLGDEGDLKSPNFCSVAESGGQYGFGQWVTNSNNKGVSPNDTHNHDITISFSKAKNQQNLFRDDVEVRKSSLKQILEYDCEEINQQNERKEYLQKEMEGILALKSVYSENYKTPGQSTENTPKKNKKNQNSQTQELLIQSKSSPKKTQKQKKLKKNLEKGQSQLSQNKQSKITEEKLTPCFNDYDTDFPKAPKEMEASGLKNGLKLSKKMQELKQKISSRANLLKQKGDFSKYSLNNTLLRKFRNSCSLDKSSDSRNSTRFQRLKEKLCRTMLLDQQENQSSDFKPEQRLKKKLSQEKGRENQKEKDKVLSKPEKLKTLKSNNDAKLMKMKSQEQIKTPSFLDHNIQNGLNGSAKIDSPKKILKKQSKIEINNNAKISTQNKGKQKQVKMGTTTIKKSQKSKDKKQTFTDMIKKDHHGNTSKKSHSENNDEEYIKFSQVVQSKCVVPLEENLFSSTHNSNQIIASEDYQFFDVRETAKQRTSEVKKEKEMKARKSQIAKLKEIAEELNKKEAKLRSSVNSIGIRQSQNNSTQEQSMKNITYCDKSMDYDKQVGNMTTLNYQDLLESFQQYMIKEDVQRPKERSNNYRLEKKKAKSLEHSKSIGSKNKLIIF